MRKTLVLAVAVGGALVLLTGMGGAQTMPAEMEKMGPGAMVIYSESLELNDTTRRVTFAGAVRAEKDDFVIECARMEVHYQGAPNESGNAETGSRVEKVVATGGVVITRASGGTATSEQAVYYQDGEKAVLTGNPMVKQGTDYVQGERIIIFFRENRSVVEGGKKQRVKAVIFPREEKR